MHKMSSANVLIIGMTGLGIEIGKTFYLILAKNVVLAGVKSVSVHDPTPVQISDLSSQVISSFFLFKFFLRDSDIGHRRDESCLPRLAELNNYVKTAVEPNLTVDALQKYQVVVAIHLPYSKQLEINHWTHSHGVKFIAADIRGLFG
jgi:ubiquitin-activating enzyme E1